MVPIPSSQTSHRKNRRRERPGARKRRALAMAHEVAEGMSMASDYSLDLPLPNHHSHALSRQHLNYDRNWKAWKAREEESRAQAMEKEKNSVRQSERDAYISLFGGEADDDEPRAFSISYKSTKSHKAAKKRLKAVVAASNPARIRARRPASAMSLPFRPARATTTAQIEQRPLPSFTSQLNTKTTPQSLPSATDPGASLCNSSLQTFNLPFHPAPAQAPSDISQRSDMAKQQHPHSFPPPSSKNDGKS